MAADKPLEVIVLAMGDFNVLPVGACKLDLNGKKVYTEASDHYNSSPGKWNDMLAARCELEFKSSTYYDSGRHFESCIDRAFTSVPA
eukprot:338487-Karenia_brevis.AAC.1